MAKAEKDSGNKSEVIPGGTKVSDLPKSVGGTKDGAPNTNTLTDSANTAELTKGEAPKLAPVTTDAAAVTPKPPTAEPFADPGVIAGGRPERAPLSNRIPAPNEGAAKWDGKPLRNLKGDGFDGDEIDLDADAPPLPVMRTPAMAMMGSDSQPTVADLFAGFRKFARAVKARDWPTMFRTAGGLILVFSDIMDNGSHAGVTLADAEALAGADRLGVELATARNELSPVIAAGRGPQWFGGEPHPVSGAAVPLGVPKGADATAVDPQSLLVIFEAVMKLWEMFRKRRS